MKNSKILGLAAAVALLAAVPAQAAIIDFTKSADWGALAGNNYTSPTTFSGVAVTLKSLGGSLTFNAGEQPVTCAGVTGLFCNGDGVGIADDEVTVGAVGTVSAGERLTVHFSVPVKFNSIGFLDLFGAYALSGDSGGVERAMWTYAAAAGTEDGFLLGTDVSSNPTVGWAQTGTLNAGWYTDITFFANNPPAPSNTDFALAKIDFTPIPEPGSMLLLGSGLIGLAGAVRRRLRK